MTISVRVFVGQKLVALNLNDMGEKVSFPD